LIVGDGQQDIGPPGRCGLFSATRRKEYDRREQLEERDSLAVEHDGFSFSSGGDPAIEKAFWPKNLALPCGAFDARHSDTPARQSQ
jgi:hypothetical protein